MDKFSQKTSKAIMFRGLFYLLGGIVAFFVSLAPGGEATKLMSYVCLLSGGSIIVGSFGHKTKQQIWFLAIVWGIIEIALGAYFMIYEPDYEFFVNLLGILSILTALFVITISFTAKKKQNFLFLIAILTGAWGFGVSAFYAIINDYFGLLLIGYLILTGLLSIYGGLLYQSVHEKLARKKMSR